VRRDRLRNAHKGANFHPDGVAGEFGWLGTDEAGDVAEPRWAEPLTPGFLPMRPGPGVAITRSSVCF
jgi:hypothetical protein